MESIVNVTILVVLGQTEEFVQAMVFAIVAHAFVTLDGLDQTALVLIQP